MSRTQCRHFNGYKPCLKSYDCDTDCQHFERPDTSILIVHLGAMGSVLRSTSLLASIKRKYPKSLITWLTEDYSKPLLVNNSLIDRILGLTTRDLLVLSGLKFDVGFFIDKSPEMGGLIKMTQPSQCFGFTNSAVNGAILPLNFSGQELWEIGLNNQKKFFENKKTEIQLVAEMLELPYQRDEYIVNLSPEEMILSEKRRKQWSENGKKIIIGLNTGTSGVIPHKTMSTVAWGDLIRIIFARFTQNNFQFQIVLLGGGKEDHERNLGIARQCLGKPIVVSPALAGLRDGLASIEATDTVITADSLGMHMAIALKKYVIAWFGPTCAHEIDLYDRGVKIESVFACSPCWNRECSVVKPCNQLIEIDQIIDSLLNFFATIRSYPLYQGEELR